MSKIGSSQAGSLRACEHPNKVIARRVEKTREEKRTADARSEWTVITQPSQWALVRHGGGAVEKLRRRVPRLKGDWVSAGITQDRLITRTDSGRAY